MGVDSGMINERFQDSWPLTLSYQFTVLYANIQGRFYSTSLDQFNEKESSRCCTNLHWEVSDPMWPIDFPASRLIIN
jgi:hypothetical protein